MRGLSGFAFQLTHPCFNLILLDKVLFIDWLALNFSVIFSLLFKVKCNNCVNVIKKMGQEPNQAVDLNITSI